MSLTPKLVNSLCLSSEAAVNAIYVGTSLAVCTTLDVIGTVKWLSHIIRIGFDGFSVRQVRLGLSALTVFEPTRIAATRLRISCECIRDSSLVTHFEWPLFVAILPSALIAVFIITYGVFVLI